MPFSSNTFISFKWWRSPGIDAAVWFCHNDITDGAILLNLSRSIRNLNGWQLSNWLISVFNLGTPSILSRINTGIENIWVTGQSIIKMQKDGHFPDPFYDTINIKMAGIIANRVNGSDRPDHVPTDYCLDIICTFTTNENAPPILHRERIPQWTSAQRTTIGRYTTGPLTTIWSRI